MLLGLLSALSDGTAGLIMSLIKVTSIRCIGDLLWVVSTSSPSRACEDDGSNILDDLSTDLTYLLQS